MVGGTTAEELISSDIVRITGQDEAYAAHVDQDVDGKNRLKVKAKVADIIDAAGIQGALTVGTSAVEVRIGTFRLANRRTVTVQSTNGPIYWGWTSGVTTATGTKLFPWQTATFEVGDTPIYLIAESAGVNVRVTEAAWVP